MTLPLLAANLGSAPMNVDGLTLDLLSVERRGSVLTVKWAVRNEGKKSETVMLKLAGKSATSYVVDEESGTKYFALTDKEGQLLATEHEYEGIWESIAEGQTKRFWAKFPAPPPAVKSINVLFSDTEPFESIAITDK
ncbi:MAG TPA: hypothetical protein VNA69_10420 [Thermoanaerobaculia bacterium]|nr:hypothetical protein [Thermoanaerobaculia bacterium]